MAARKPERRMTKINKPEAIRHIDRPTFTSTAARATARICPLRGSLLFPSHMAEPAEQHVFQPPPATFMIRGALFSYFRRRARLPLSVLVDVAPRRRLKPKKRFRIMPITMKIGSAKPAQTIADMALLLWWAERLSSPSSVDPDDLRASAMAVPTQHFADCITASYSKKPG